MMMPDMSNNSRKFLTWWVLALAGAAVAVLVAWLARVVTVPVTTLLTVGLVVIGLSWLVGLVTVPWNLYFAARRAAAAMVISRERGISVRADDDAEAGRIARRMLWFALGAHLATALAAAAISFFAGGTTGYYVAGLFLISTAFRPAAAYLGHVRERIGALTRQSTHPRDDVAALRGRLDRVDRSQADIRRDVERLQGDLVRTGATLADSVAHARQVITTDLARLADAQAADRAAARSRDDDLRRQIEQMVRRVETTLDGVSDHQELLTGIRALVRMVRADPA
jgi:hypothetical protein